MRLIFDENLSPSHAIAARARGLDAVSVVEMGLCGAPDEAVRSAAIASDRVLVTLDADFGNILRYPPSSTPGVIWLRLHPPTEHAIAAALDRIFDRLGAATLRGKLAVVDEDKIRIRG